MFDIIYSFFGKIIYGCYFLVKSYPVAILLFAFVLKLIFFPLGIKQQKNSIRQAKLRPKEMAIRKKYAGRNDKATQQKMQQEIMDLYTQEKYNPMSGCLPLLIQLPILFIVYRVVIKPLSYIASLSDEVINTLSNIMKEGADKLVNVASSTVETIKSVDAASLMDRIGQINGTTIIRDNFDMFSNTLGSQGIKSASELPNFELFGINFGTTPGFELSLWLIIPVLTFVVYFFGAKLTRKFTYNPQTAMGGDASKSMAIMDLVMPLFSVLITFNVPALIGIYWIFNSLLGTLQQFILSKIYPLPEFTEEDFKRAELEMKGKSPKTKSSSNPNKKKKSGYSLHHIDDDEDDEPQSKAPSNKNKSGMASMIDRPELKEDRKPEEKSGEKSEEKPEEGEGGQN